MLQSTEPEGLRNKEGVKGERMGLPGKGNRVGGLGRVGMGTGGLSVVGSTGRHNWNWGVVFEGVCIWKPSAVETPWDLQE